MELILMYRWLRQVSTWVTTGYYSEVYIEGAENVPPDVPIIMYVPSPGPKPTLCLNLPEELRRTKTRWSILRLSRLPFRTVAK